MRRIITTLSLGIMMNPCIWAAEAHLKPASDDTAANVRVCIKQFRITTANLQELVKGDTDAPESLYKRIKLATNQGKARLLDIDILTCLSGNRITSESVREFIYPTEIEPNIFLGPTLGGLGAFSPQMPLFRTPTPTAFETRHVGVTIELETKSLNHGKNIHVLINHESTSLHNFLTYYDFQDSRGKADIVTPQFLTQRTNEKVELPNNIYELIRSVSIFNNAGEIDPSEKHLIFAKATVISP